MTDGAGGPPGNFSNILGDFSAQADAMVKAANEGQFAVSPEMGEAYKTALQDYLDSWTGNKIHFDSLANSPELGTSPYTEQIGRHMTMVAAGDDQSAKTQLETLQAVVERAQAAIDTAISKYQASDHAASKDLSDIGKEIH
ncbi:hypothetical protein NQK81_20955 [Amycolatopsis roodepoortensis]|uniref:hypothetical protein n=1 Tax=Amycolatopsis roodepoortensis TaxID=700274 RepID=UPI00214C83D6|nr:hypothetical protein [Amycolatopsis roodepoortensis]UUV35803.1 hypothetical protein NQK81_20955 [Amycolatopsis roodepoortensis]